MQMRKYLKDILYATLPGEWLLQDTFQWSLCGNKTLLTALLVHLALDFEKKTF